MIYIVSSIYSKSVALALSITIPDIRSYLNRHQTKFRPPVGDSPVPFLWMGEISTQDYGVGTGHGFGGRELQTGGTLLVTHVPGDQFHWDNWQNFPNQNLGRFETKNWRCEVICSVAGPFWCLGLPLPQFWGWATKCHKIQLKNT